MLKETETEETIDFLSLVAFQLGKARPPLAKATHKKFLQVTLQ